MKRIAWIVVIVLWMLILASSLGARIEADDYCYAEVVETAGIVGSINHWYFNWAGLYTDQVISSILAAVEPYGTRIGVPILLAAVVLAWWYAFAHWYGRKDALLLSLAFGAALVMSRPNDEPIYWLSGVTSYWLPFAGVGLLIGAFLRRRTVLAVLTAFLTVSLTEAGGALIVVGLGLAFLFWKGERRRLLLVLASASLGFLIVYLAPGNAVRRAAIGPIEYSPQLAVGVLLGSFATNFVLSLVFSIFPGLFLSGMGALLPPSFPMRRLPLFFLILVIGASLFLAFVALVSTGWGLPPRTIYLLTPLWLAQWFILGAIVGQRFPGWGWAAVVIGMALVIFAGRHVFERLSYGQRWDARHAAILAGYRVQGDIGQWDTLTDTEWALACAEAWYDRDIRYVDGGNVP